MVKPRIATATNISNTTILFFIILIFKIFYYVKVNDHHLKSLRIFTLSRLSLSVILTVMICQFLFLLLNQGRYQ